MKISEIRQVTCTCHSGSAQCKVALGECPCPEGVHRQAVLKCRVGCYSGVVRPAHQETVATEEIVVTHSSQEEGTQHPVQGRTGKHLSWPGNGRNGRRCRQDPLLGFLRKERARQGKQP